MSRPSAVLTFPRDILPAEPFTPWAAVRPLLAAVTSRHQWTPRVDAERSATLVQAIPVAVLADAEGRRLVLRRVEDASPRLRSRYSLVVGGHVDLPREEPRPQVRRAGDLVGLLLSHLQREVAEELGVRLVQVSPLGVLVDPTSTDASRHAAFAWTAVMAEPPRVTTEDEFRGGADGPVYATRGLSPRLRQALDPWSSIVLDNSPSGAPSGAPAHASPGPSA